MRAINAIAAEIAVIWRNKSPGRTVHVDSMPYLQAMLEIRNINDTYGLETGDDIVNRFLSNAANWRGHDAKRLKDELRAILGSKNVHS